MTSINKSMGEKPGPHPPPSLQKSHTCQDLSESITQQGTGAVFYGKERCDGEERCVKRSRDSETTKKNKGRLKGGMLISTGQRLSGGTTFLLDCKDKGADRGASEPCAADEIAADI